MNRRFSVRLAATCLWALGAVASARADLLVTRDGTATIETVGTWKVQGRMIVFTLPGGALSTIRADEIDLDRSSVATARAAEQVAARAEESTAKPAPLGEPIFRITDEDVAPPPPPPEEEGEGEGEVEGGNAGPAASSGPLEVISWDQLDLAEGDGVEIFGTLRNNSRAIVSAPGVTVLVYGERGGLLATSDGSVNLESIPPGKTANFRAPLPGLTEFAAIKFDLTGRGYKVRDEGGASDEGEEAGEPEEAAAEEEIEIDPGAKYDALALEPPPEPEPEATDEYAPEADEAIEEAESEEPPPAA